jgi:hypothetical protein
LVACSDLRAYVGEVAYGLHSRRTAKYDRITGFLKEHGKTAKCAYSRMILDCYPDAPVAKEAAMPSDAVGAFISKVDSTRAEAMSLAGLSMSDEEEAEEMQGKSAADQMLRKAFVPDTVDGWLEWEDGSRTAAKKEMSKEDRIRHLKGIAKAMQDYLDKASNYDHSQVSDPLTKESLRSVEREIKALESGKKA